MHHWQVFFWKILCENVYFFLWTDISQPKGFCSIYNTLQALKMVCDYPFQMVLVITNTVMHNVLYS